MANSAILKQYIHEQYIQNKHVYSEIIKMKYK